MSDALSVVVMTGSMVTQLAECNIRGPLFRLRALYEQYCL